MVSLKRMDNAEKSDKTDEPKTNDLKNNEDSVETKVKGPKETELSESKLKDSNDININDSSDNSKVKDDKTLDQAKSDNEMTTDSVKKSFVNSSIIDRIKNKLQILNTEFEENLDNREELREKSEKIEEKSESCKIDVNDKQSGNDVKVDNKSKDNEKVGEQNVEKEEKSGDKEIEKGDDDRTKADSVEKVEIFSTVVNEDNQNKNYSKELEHNKFKSDGSLSRDSPEEYRKKLLTTIQSCKEKLGIDNELDEVVNNDDDNGDDDDDENDDEFVVEYESVVSDDDDVVNDNDSDDDDDDNGEYESSIDSDDSDTDRLVIDTDVGKDSDAVDGEETKCKKTANISDSEGTQSGIETDLPSKGNANLQAANSVKYISLNVNTNSLKVGNVDSSISSPKLSLSNREEPMNGDLTISDNKNNCSNPSQDLVPEEPMDCDLTTSDKDSPVPLVDNDVTCESDVSCDEVKSGSGKNVNSIDTDKEIISESVRIDKDGNDCNMRIESGSNETVDSNKLKSVVSDKHKTVISDKRNTLENDKQKTTKDDNDKSIESDKNVTSKNADFKAIERDEGKKPVDGNILGSTKSRSVEDSKSETAIIGDMLTPKSDKNRTKNNDVDVIGKSSALSDSSNKNVDNEKCSVLKSDNKKTMNCADTVITDQISLTSDKHKSHGTESVLSKSPQSGKNETQESDKNKLQESDKSKSKTCDKNELQEIDKNKLQEIDKNKLQESDKNKTQERVVDTTENEHDISDDCIEIKLDESDENELHESVLDKLQENAMSKLQVHENVLDENVLDEIQENVMSKLQESVNNDSAENQTDNVIPTNLQCNSSVKNKLHEKVISKTKDIAQDKSQGSTNSASVESAWNKKWELVKNEPLERVTNKSQGSVSTKLPESVLNESQKSFSNKPKARFTNKSQESIINKSQKSVSDKPPVKEVFKPVKSMNVSIPPRKEITKTTVYGDSSKSKINGEKARESFDIDKVKIEETSNKGIDDTRSTRDTSQHSQDADEVMDIDDNGDSEVEDNIDNDNDIACTTLLSELGHDVSSCIPDENFTTPVSFVTPTQSHSNTGPVTMVTDDVNTPGVASLMIEKYSKKMLGKIQQIMDDMCTEVFSQQGDKDTDSVQSVKQQLAQQKWMYETEINELKHNFQLGLQELKVTWETEKEQLRKSMMAKHNSRLEKAIKDVKKKQWCAQCGKESIFYCCWNTSYCDYPCQQAHWPVHLSSCLQVNKDKTSTSAPKPTGQKSVSQVQVSSEPVVSMIVSNVPRMAPRQSGSVVLPMNEPSPIQILQDMSSGGQVRKDNKGMESVILPRINTSKPSPLLQNINIRQPTPDGIYNMTLNTPQHQFVTRGGRLVAPQQTQNLVQTLYPIQMAPASHHHQQQHQQQQQQQQQISQRFNLQNSQHLPVHQQLQQHRMNNTILFQNAGPNMMPFGPRPK
ncbi:Protein kinase C-binding protein 1 [Mactra antiquata]